MSKPDSSPTYTVGPHSSVALRKFGAHVSPGWSKGRLTALGEQFRMNKFWYVVFECQCGSIVAQRVINASVGDTYSCGCAHDEKAGEKLRRFAERCRERGWPSTTHGLSKHRLHRTWRGIKGRCCNPKNAGYHLYGAKGVKVCDEWLNDFKAFYDWAMANGYAEDLTIDRKNSRGNYEPDNCRWVTPSVNSALARWKHGKWASTVIPESVETPFSKALTPGRGGKHHPDNCVPKPLYATRKLNPDKVRDIRRRLVAGERGVDLAKEYGVNVHTISHIRLFKTWADVA